MISIDLLIQHLYFTQEMQISTWSCWESNTERIVFSLILFRSLKNEAAIYSGLPTKNSTKLEQEIKTTRVLPRGSLDREWKKSDTAQLYFSWPFFSSYWKKLVLRWICGKTVVSICSIQKKFVQLSKFFLNFLTTCVNFEMHRIKITPA